MIKNNSVDLGSNVQHFGPVTINGDIPAGVQIHIQEGSLVVNGNIGPNVTIHCTAEPGTLFGFFNALRNWRSVGRHSDRSGFVSVSGTVADNVKVDCVSKFIAMSNIQNHFNLNLHNGNVSAMDIGESSTISVHNGNVQLQDIGENSNVTTHNGNIRAFMVCDNSVVTSHNGNIRLDVVGEFAKIHSHNGNVKVIKTYETTSVQADSGRVEPYKIMKNYHNTSFTK